MYSFKKLTQPAISIVICNYNYEKYIARTIESALNQNYPACEVIIVDDGSTDASLKVIERYTQQPHVQLISKKNGGQVSAYNEALPYITGDVVIFLDSDDELHSNALEEVAKSFDINVVKVHFKMRVVDSNGKDLDVVLPRYLDAGDCGANLVKDGVLYKSSPASGNAFRVEALKKIFPLPTLPNEKHSADFFCIYGIALVGEIASIPQALFNYRVHQKNNADNIGFGNALSGYDIQQAAEIRWRVFREWAGTLNLTEKTISPGFLDFNQQKLFYSIELIQAKGLASKYLIFKKHIGGLLKSITVRNDLHALGKLALSIWALSIWLIPKPTSHYLIKKICNPSGH